MSQLIIGLTGGIATGKSTVSQYFKQLGIHIVDADLIARQVVEPGTPALAQIAEHFGETILNSDHSLNRAKLREIIFSDNATSNNTTTNNTTTDNANTDNVATKSTAKQWLNNLLHPLIRTEITHQLNSASGPYVILDAPLLFENKLDAICTYSVLVDIPEPLQIKRATQRDTVSNAQIQKIIDAQMPRMQKQSKADYIIDNTGSLDATMMQVRTLHTAFIEKSKR